MMAADHLESALERLQRIITLASRPDAPITRSEAFEHIVEQMELAGFGSPEPPEISPGNRSFARET